MSKHIPGADLVLVRGLYEADRVAPVGSNQSRRQQSGNISRQFPSLGVLDYERVDGRGRTLANRLLRRIRKTANPPDAMEIMLIDQGSLRHSIASEVGRAASREISADEKRHINFGNSMLLLVGSK